MVSTADFGEGVSFHPGKVRVAFHVAHIFCLIGNAKKLVVVLGEKNAETGIVLMFFFRYLLDIRYDNLIVVSFDHHDNPLQRFGSSGLLTNLEVSKQRNLA